MRHFVIAAAVLLGCAMPVHAADVDFGKQVRATKWLADELNRRPLDQKFAAALKDGSGDYDRLNFEKLRKSWDATSSELQFVPRLNTLQVLNRGRQVLALRVLSEDPLKIALSETEVAFIDRRDVTRSVRKYLASRAKAGGSFARRLFQALENDASAAGADQPVGDILGIEKTLTIYAMGQVAALGTRGTLLNAFPKVEPGFFSKLFGGDGKTEMTCTASGVNGKLKIRDTEFSFQLEGDEVTLSRRGLERPVKLKLGTTDLDPKAIAEKIDKDSSIYELDYLMSFVAKERREALRTRFYELKRYRGNDPRIPDREGDDIDRLARAGYDLVHKIETKCPADVGYETCLSRSEMKFPLPFLREELAKAAKPIRAHTIDLQSCDREKCQPIEDLASVLNAAPVTPDPLAGELRAKREALAALKQRFKVRFGTEVSVEKNDLNQWVLRPDEIPNVDGKTLGEYKDAMVALESEINSLSGRSNNMQGERNQKQMDDRHRVGTEFASAYLTIKALKACCGDQNCKADLASRGGVNLAPAKPVK